MRKMNTRLLIRSALIDAIGCQQGEFYKHPAGSPEREKARELRDAYKALLKRRYGDEKESTDAR